MVRVLIVLGLTTLCGLVVVLLWKLGQELLILFLGVVLSTLLTGLAEKLQAHTPLTMGASRWAVVALLLGVLVGGGLLVAPILGPMLTDLDTQLLEATQRIRDWAEGVPLLAQMSSELLDGSMLSEDMALLTRLAQSALRALTGLLAVLIIGVFCTLQPDLYARGILWLFPKRHRATIAKLQRCQRDALRGWMQGQLVSMVFVGLSMGIGLWAIGLEQAMILGLIAGLCAFVPIAGVWLGSLPAILIASMSSTRLTFVLLLFLGVQFLETNVVTPLAQQRAVKFPPALIIIAELLLSSLAGVLGLIVATPLSVVLMVAIQELYVRNALGEDIDVLGATD